MAFHREQPPGVGLRGYLSYSHADQRLVERLRVHLKALELSQGIAFWHDTEITSGTDWMRRISNAIAAADVFILCFSPDYIASRYRHDVEWPAIRDRGRTGQALVVPLILRPCMWFGFVDMFQVVPAVNGRVRPITEWRRRDDGLDAAVQQISAGIQAYVANPVPLPTVDDALAGLSVPYAPASSEKLSLDEIDQAVQAVIKRRTEKTAN